MDLRVDLHLFTELCEAIRRQEPVVLYGRDQKSSASAIEIPAEAVKLLRPRPQANSGEQSKAEPPKAA